MAYSTQVQTAVETSRQQHANGGSNIYDLHVYRQCKQYDMIPQSIQQLILSSLTFEECLDKLANRIVHQYHESESATTQIDLNQIEINEQIIELMQYRFDRSVPEIHSIVGDLCQYKVEVGEYNCQCEMLTGTYN